MTSATVDRLPVAQLTPLLRRLVGDEKHEPSGYSTLDLIWVLYDRILRVDPAAPDAPERDRFLVSKGHGPHAYYAVLAAKGFIPVEWLDGFAGPDNPLGHHPDRTLVPGVEISSGSLGHGLGLAVGTALGLRVRGWRGPGQDRPEQGVPVLDSQAQREPRVYVLVGDGELDEGSNHEAIAYAGATGLDSLTVMVVDNGSPRHPSPGGLSGLFTNHGWTSVTVPATDHDRLEAALRAHQTGRPHVVVVQVEGQL